ncbi:response regulator [Taibaiella soli]|uniref:DNA-binding response regulator n=1 Tax=Taibaiella soli TaxID=1649169 RepID=A0A2W2AK96_9BACT|nr:response regulator transcription factor [Taibaiella soli]PZF72680.1 DNA-binding response regulator [Taibaiella soli]
MSEVAIKVSVTDDHPLVISGLQTMLARHAHIQLVGAYGNGVELLRGLETEVPDVLLLDIQMPDKTGDSLAPLLRKKYPDLKIIVLTNFDSTLYANNMMKLGVHGYVLKSAAEQVIIDAIEVVYNGGTFVEDLMKRKMDLLQDKVSKAVFAKVSLTPREKDILEHIANGDTNQEIADRLFLSVRTVENYRLNIQLKLGAKNTAILIKIALQMGFLDK